MASELATRTRSAVLLSAVALGLTVLHPYSFTIMVAIGLALLWREWQALTRPYGLGWLAFGVVYIGIAGACLLYLRFTSLPILLSLIAIVCAADIAAYLVGKQFGRHKIAPRISPGKSWEGLAGGIVAAAATGAMMSGVAPVPHAILGAALAIIGLGGDLFESWLKRRAGVKDSGTLIPGHGGLFDRLDALLPCAIVAALVMYIRLHWGT